MSDLKNRLEQRAYMWGPSQRNYVGNGLYMATADIVQKVVDKDCADALAELARLTTENARLREAATRLLSVFDEQRQIAQRIIVAGRSDNVLRAEGTEYATLIAELRENAEWARRELRQSQAEIFERAADALERATGIKTKECDHSSYEMLGMESGIPVKQCLKCGKVFNR